MKTKLTLLLGLLPSVLGIPALAQGTAFIYQGRLESGGTPYTGSAEIQATLWDAVSGSGQIAANNPAILIVGVTNGLFVLPLDFGDNFPGADRWLQLEVRTTIGPFTMLSPRQPLKATPYAITAGHLAGPLAAAQLSGPIPSASLSGTYSGPVMFNNAASSFSGSGAGVTGLNASQLANGTVPNARLAASVSLLGQSVESSEIADGTIQAVDVNAASFNTTFWRATGNAGTTPGTQFIGTTDNQPLDFRVDNRRVLRLEPTGSNSVNLVGGWTGNYVTPGVIGATIGGGGTGNWFGFVQTNSVTGNFGVVSGGAGNNASSLAATVGGWPLKRRQRRGVNSIWWEQQHSLEPVFNRGRRPEQHCGRSLRDSWRRRGEYRLW